MSLSMKEGIASRRVRIPDQPITSEVLLPDLPRSPPRPLRLNILPPTQSSIQQTLSESANNANRTLYNRLQTHGYEGRPAVASAGMVMTKPTSGVPNQDFSWWRNAVPFGLSLPMTHPPPPPPQPSSQPERIQDFSGVPINLTMPVPSAPPMPTIAMPPPNITHSIKSWNVATAPVPGEMSGETPELKNPPRREVPPARDETITAFLKPQSNPNLAAGDYLTNWLANRLTSTENPASGAIVSLPADNPPSLAEQLDTQRKDFRQAATSARGLGTRYSQSQEPTLDSTTTAGTTATMSGKRASVITDKSSKGKEASPPAKLAVPGVYDLVATIMGIDVVPFIKPKNYFVSKACSNASPAKTPSSASPSIFSLETIEWSKKPENSRIPAFTWSNLNKSGYLQVSNDGQSIDGRLGIGNIFGSQGFRVGIVEWVFICENSEGRLRCGITNPVLSKFPVASTWGFSRHKLHRAGYAWLSNMIPAQKGMKIQVILDLRGAQAAAGASSTKKSSQSPSSSSISPSAGSPSQQEQQQQPQQEQEEGPATYLVVIIDDEPKFRLTGLPENMTFFPVLFVEGCAITGQYGEGREVDPWWSLNGDIQAKTRSLREPVDVMEITKTSGDRNFRTKFRDERRERMLSEYNREQQQLQNSAWKAMDIVNN